MEKTKEKWCEYCQSTTIQKVWNELEYSDGASEAHMSNHLVEVEYSTCNDCGEDN